MKSLPPELTDRIIDFLYKDYRTLSKCAIVCRQWLPSSRFHIPQRALPTELTNQIIDFLQDDYDALCACALVCHDWLPSARLHIFENCRLNLDQEMLECSPQIGPQIGLLIRKLKISRLLESGLFENTALVNLCELFPNANDIIVSGIEDGVWTFQSLLDIIMSKPHLQTFGIEYMEIPVTDKMPTEKFRTSIDTLILTNVDWDLHLFVGRAIAADIFSSVHTLHYTCNIDQHHESGGICSFLRHYGCNLTNVSINELPCDYSDGCLKALKYLANAREIDLNVTLPANEPRKPKEWLLSTLPKVSQGITSADPLRVSIKFHQYFSDNFTVIPDQEFGRDFVEMWNKTAKPRPEGFRFALTMDARFVPADDPHLPPAILKDAQSTFTWEML